MEENLRHQAVVEALRERPFLSVNELRDLVGVSAATVRRDIEKLAAAGRATKVYGGVTALDGALQQRPVALPFSDNRDIAVDAKRAIAAAAAELVRDGSQIIVHAGSTCFHFGVRIADRNVRVATHSMPLAAYLGEHGTCQVIVGGGDLHREPGLLYEAGGLDTDFFAQQFFVGALGVSAKGILESHPLLVKFVQHFADRANEVILLADSRKFEERPPSVALPLWRVARVVTDSGLSDAHRQMIEDAGVQLTIADPEVRP
ncbi:transcriptional regulator, DeoR family [Palleronia marisminoris]|uniref:HTH-type transcriptional regulator UlaR n=1 Tax=Palleronia marisminoris TaxID=315423 RepID=A0A1Y5RX50_9RHOB|nr:DeoR/GlpR family DNA-binding transcription regulator [Palleronia marisminoris]SFG44796.1 transcriptional regulator, DeoR family [Palleronia marisminoris]SLN26465.1 HTH-type transcriptional regulator UlaR [Palleronia marisminoris]